MASNTYNINVSSIFERRCSTLKNVYFTFTVATKCLHGKQNFENGPNSLFPNDNIFMPNSIK